MDDLVLFFHFSFLNCEIHFSVLMKSKNCELTQHGNSALHEAAWRGYSQTVTILTQQKANVNAVNRAGFTPLHLCCQNGHNETCRVLLWADANPDAKNHVKQQQQQQLESI